MCTFFLYIAPHSHHWIICRPNVPSSMNALSPLKNKDFLFTKHGILVKIRTFNDWRSSITECTFHSQISPIVSIMSLYNVLHSYFPVVLPHPSPLHLAHDHVFHFVVNSFSILQSPMIPYPFFVFHVLSISVECTSTWVF